MSAISDSLLSSSAKVDEEIRKPIPNSKKISNGHTKAEMINKLPIV